MRANEHLAGAARRPVLAARALDLKLKGTDWVVVGVWNQGIQGAVGHLKKSS